MRGSGGSGRSQPADGQGRTMSRPTMNEQASPAVGTGGDTLVRVLFETVLGCIEIDVDTARAPGTAANFLRYVDGGHYNGGRFHRTVTPDNQPGDAVKIEVIQ